MIRTLMVAGALLGFAAACGGRTTDVGAPGGASEPSGSGSGSATGGGSGSSSAPSPGEACSNGPAYLPGTSFPFSSSDDDMPLSKCVAHCGEPVYSPSRGYPTTASLPSGSCATEGRVCGMDAEQVCACPPGETAQGPYTGFECRCAGGQWQCAIRSQGMSICTCDGKIPGTKP